MEGRRDEVAAEGESNRPPSNIAVLTPNNIGNNGSSVGGGSLPPPPPASYQNHSRIIQNQQQQQQHQLEQSSSHDGNNGGGGGFLPNMEGLNPQQHQQQQQYNTYNANNNPNFHLMTLNDNNYTHNYHHPDNNNNTNHPQLSSSDYYDTQEEEQHYHSNHYQQQPPNNQNNQQQHQMIHGGPLWDQPSDNNENLFSSHCCLCVCCIFKSFLTNLWNAENLHRAFCFGAIDGMLTGSGIASASAGLGLFDAYGTLQQRLAIVALSMSACTADGLCMGIGHVWSTYVMKDSAARERSAEMWTFRHQRGASKAKLVDMLLMRGMLKIDAMSVADTLEGYPDIWLSAIVGDANARGPLGLVGEDEEEEVLRQQQQQQQHGGGGGRMGRIMAAEDEYEDDSGYESFSMGECQNEGLVMMLAFCVFSVLPALIYAFIPLWIYPNRARTSEGGGVNEFAQVLEDGGMSLTTLTLTPTALIMLFLGIWKSKFFASSWIIFGIETVIVLVLCIMSAYFLGLVVGSLIGIQALV